MGEGTPDAGRAGIARPPHVERLEDEIEDLRASLGRLMAEIDRRRHEILDWRLQLRKRAPALPFLLGATALAVAAGTISSIVRIKHRRTLHSTLPERARRARAAMRLASLARARPAHSERAAPTVTRRALTAAATAMASTMGRGLARRWAARLWNPAPAGGPGVASAAGRSTAAV